MHTGGNLNNEYVKGQRSNVRCVVVSCPATHLPSDICHLTSYITVGYAPNGNSTAYEYDKFARITKLTENIDGQNFDNQYEYDNFGNLTKFIYPSGYTVQKNYDNNGYLTQASAPQGTIFTSDEMNALNQYTEYTLGSGALIEKSYNDFGMMTRTSTSGIQDLMLDWNTSSGNLNLRVDIIKNKLEQFFVYDNLNRLNFYQVTGQPLFTVGYANNGNITSKTDAGTYTYDPSKPHAVQSVTDPLGLMPLTQNITYTPFKRPAIVTEGDYELTFTYGPDQQRKKSLLTNLNSGVVEKIITYSGGYEKIETPTDVYEVHYINAGPALAINVKQNNGSDQLFYAYRDHLGSILTLTDASGNVVYEQNFDPWGRERNPNTWDYTANPNTKPAWLIRGFTGHEHNDEVKLINMNARMYDPIVARMLSPDNLVQDATSTQGFNRYSYVVNNPLIYTDPDGENPLLIAALIIAGLTGTANLALNWNNLHGTTGQKILQGAGYFGIGAAAGFAGTYLGYGAFQAGMFIQSTTFAAASAGQLAGGFALAGGVGLGSAGFISGFGSTMINTRGDFQQSLRVGATLAGYGFAIGTAVGGLYGLASGSIRDWRNPIPEIPPIDYSNVYASSDFNYGAYSGGASFLRPRTGTFAGTHYGVNIYESSLVPGGVALPPHGIWVYEGAYSNDKQLLWHEYGHVLDWTNVGTWRYYNEIAPYSFYSNTFNPKQHKNYWTETRANTLSLDYIWRNRIQFEWNYIRFPVE